MEGARLFERQRRNVIARPENVFAKGVLRIEDAAQPILESPFGRAAVAHRLLLQDHIALPLGFLRADIQLREFTCVKAQQLFDVGFRAFGAARKPLPKYGGNPVGVAVGLRVGEEQHRNGLVLGPASQEHQMLEVMREAVATALRFVAASGPDNHPNGGRRRSRVGHDDDVRRDPGFGGKKRRRREQRDNEACRNGRCAASAVAHGLLRL